MRSRKKPIFEHTNCRNRTFIGPRPVPANAVHPHVRSSPQSLSSVQPKSSPSPFINSSWGGSHLKFGEVFITTNHSFSSWESLKKKLVSSPKYPGSDLHIGRKFKPGCRILCFMSWIVCFKVAWSCSQGIYNNVSRGPYVPLTNSHDMFPNSENAGYSLHMLAVSCLRRTSHWQVAPLDSSSASCPTSSGSSTALHCCQHGFYAKFRELSG